MGLAVSKATGLESRNRAGHAIAAGGRGNEGRQSHGQAASRCGGGVVIIWNCRFLHLGFKRRKITFNKIHKYYTTVYQKIYRSRQVKPLSLRNIAS